VFNNFTTKESYKPSTKDTFHRLLPVGEEAEAVAWHRCDDAGRIGPSANVTQLGVQRTLAADLVEPACFQKSTSANLVTRSLNNQTFRSRQTRRDMTTSPVSIPGGPVGSMLAGSTGPFVLSRGKPQVFGNVTYFPAQLAWHSRLEVRLEFMNDRSTNTANGNIGTRSCISMPMGSPAKFASLTTATQAPLAAHGHKRPTTTGTTPAMPKIGFRSAISDHNTDIRALRYDHQRPYLQCRRPSPSAHGDLVAYNPCPLRV